MDQLGRLGYTAHEILGMPDTQFPPTKPPWNKPTNLSRKNEFAYKAYTFATSSTQHPPKRRARNTPVEILM
jgi:hypothetical protein